MPHPSYSDLLMRADEVVFQDLLGQSAMRLLRTLKGRDISVGALRNIFNDLHSPEAVLSDSTKRRILLELLNHSEAQSLSQALNFRSQGIAYNDLATIQLTKGSRLMHDLLEQLRVIVGDRIEVTEAIPDLVEAIPHYSLFAHQRTAVRESISAMSVRPYRVLLHMPTGSGKTRTAMNVVSEFLRNNEPGNVLWLATSEELCEQAAQEFEKCWRFTGNRAIVVHRYWGGHWFNPIDMKDGLVVAGLQKLYSSANRELTYLAHLGDRIGLVVIDEAHQSVARSYRDVVESIIARKEATHLLGLSATPGRSWNDPNSDLELSNFFGSSKVTLRVEGYSNPIDYLVEHGYLAKPNFREIEGSSRVELTEQDRKRLAEDLEIPEVLLNRLAEDDLRNAIVLREIQALTNRHKRILVFGATVEHAQLLATVLRALGVAAKAVAGTTPSFEREQTIRWFKSAEDEVRVLTNFGVLTTGFDAPATSAAVIARPTRSLVLFSQMVGRATRGTLAGGNREAEIVTVVDTQLPGFGSLAEAFTNWDDVWY